VTPRPGLNRTSVGLKHSDAYCYAYSSSLGLNRTSVGLKLCFSASQLLQDLCLNRTSVGLKPSLGGCYWSGGGGPQSNQRGIETESYRLLWIEGRLGLNRTSVGLKLC